MTEAEKAAYWFERARHYHAETKRLREALTEKSRQLQAAWARIEEDETAADCPRSTDPHFGGHGDKACDHCDA